MEETRLSDYDSLDPAEMLSLLTSSIHRAAKQGLELSASPQGKKGRRLPLHVRSKLQLQEAIIHGSMDTIQEALGTCNYLLS